MAKKQNWWKFLHPQTPICVGTHPFAKWPSVASGSS